MRCANRCPVRNAPSPARMLTADGTVGRSYWEDRFTEEEHYEWLSGHAVVLPRRHPTALAARPAVAVRLGLPHVHPRCGSAAATGPSSQRRNNAATAHGMYALIACLRLQLRRHRERGRAAPENLGPHPRRRLRQLRCDLATCYGHQLYELYPVLPPPRYHRGLATRNPRTHPPHVVAGLGRALWERGFHKVVNLDYSEVVIEKMRASHTDCESMTWSASPRPRPRSLASLALDCSPVP